MDAPSRLSTGPMRGSAAFAPFRQAAARRATSRPSPAIMPAPPFRRTAARSCSSAGRAAISPPTNGRTIPASTGWRPVAGCRYGSRRMQRRRSSALPTIGFHGDVRQGQAPACLHGSERRGQARPCDRRTDQRVRCIARRPIFRVPPELSGACYAIAAGLAGCVDRPQGRAAAGHQGQRRRGGFHPLVGWWQAPALEPGTHTLHRQHRSLFSVRSGRR
eukprot:TRINITY_DN7697_c0_g1_i1.p2 TRINITY_DN7697_c0_g1~~TRINITY_DN7697_c0_g1_i1.p2  ORF type:complete len:218 (-),score=-80.12 TRINITY_DN7697_c0_g1_i1:103-756(-)